MEDLVLDADTLFGIADVIDGYCAKQREVINVYYAQIMALESDWRDDETFGSLVEELNSLKTQALAFIDEIYETYPKYFRKRAQQILERPFYRDETVVIPTPIFTNIPNTRVAGYTGSDTRGVFNSAVSPLAHATSGIAGERVSRVVGNEAAIDSTEVESFLWFKGGKTDKSIKSGEKKYTTKLSKDIVAQSEYKNFHKYYDFLDTLDVPQSFKDKVIKCYQNMDESLKLKYNVYAKKLKCLDSNYVEYDDNGNPYDAAHYSSKEKGFKFNWEYDIDNPCGECNTFFHESGHMLDDLIGQDLGEGLYSSATNKLSDIAKEDFSDAVSRITGENSCDRKSAIEMIEKDLYNDDSATVQDIYSGASNNGLYVTWDHQSKAEILVDKNGERIGTRTYWHKTDSQGKMAERFNRIGKGAFANITADIACNNSQAISYIQRYLPKTFAKYKEIIGGKK